MAMKNYSNAGSHSVFKCQDGKRSGGEEGHPMVN